MPVGVAAHPGGQLGHQLAGHREPARLGGHPRRDEQVVDRAPHPLGRGLAADGQADLEGRERIVDLAGSGLRLSEGRERQRGVGRGAQAPGIDDAHGELRALAGAHQVAALGLDERLDRQAQHPDDTGSAVAARGRPQRGDRLLRDPPAGTPRGRGSRGRWRSRATGCRSRSRPRAAPPPSSRAGRRSRRAPDQGDGGLDRARSVGKRAVVTELGQGCEVVGQGCLVAHQSSHPRGRDAGRRARGAGGRSQRLEPPQRRSRRGRRRRRSASWPGRAARRPRCSRRPGGAGPPRRCGHGTRTTRRLARAATSRGPDA